MHHVQGFLQRLNIKYFMVAYVALVLLTGAWGTGHIRPLLQAAVILLIYTVTDLLWTNVRDKQRYLPTSSWISGLIGSVVLAPVAPWWAVVAFPLLAVASKQLVHWQGRHIFNPAAFSLVLLSLLFPAAISWWGVAWWNATPGSGGVLLGILAGMLILTRIKRWPVTLSFFVVYGAGLLLQLLPQGVPLQNIVAVLFDGTFIFFATVMLVEPVTTAYRTKKILIGYGAGVGLLAVLGPILLPMVGITLPDGFLPALLLGNFVAAIASTRRNVKRAAPATPLVSPIQASTSPVPPQ
jgi:enediyne biosynthesis protein E5